MDNVDPVSIAALIVAMSSLTLTLVWRWGDHR
ncbi:hypothetical protein SEA_ONEIAGILLIAN_5 [Microbacterium phage OneinaGillian]|uniref:Uncharacterized protein n=1 Tax=Microbacterium phage OneinaGillian TaxID=2301604 RepID=A0A385UGI6_9CAUD|nr:hypothetical protein HOU23_gp005 [Microbacterium phage OneinaGillian]AYB70115.1 hypothetical protein SEA_ONEIAGILLIAN_5 [Microbacterium phage OneinaGillian]